MDEPNVIPTQLNIYVDTGKSVVSIVGVIKKYPQPLSTYKEFVELTHTAVVAPTDEVLTLVKA